MTLNRRSLRLKALFAETNSDGIRPSIPGVIPREVIGMRTKILAMCMTMVMLIAGTGIVIAGDQSVDADSVPTSAITDVGTVNLYQKQGAQTLVDIYLNEYAFSGYNVTVDWYVYCSTDSTIDGSGFGDVVRKDKNTARPSWATTNQTAATTNNSKPYEQDTGRSSQ